MRIFYWLDKVLPDTPPGKSPRLDFRAEPLSGLTSASLGGYLSQFRRELLEEGTVDVQTRAIMRKLEQSADDRNWLVHWFCWERASAFATPQGRGEMLAELQELVARFRANDQIIRQLVLVCLAHYERSPEQIDSPEFHSYLQMGSPV